MQNKAALVRNYQINALLKYFSLKLTESSFSTVFSSNPKFQYQYLTNKLSYVVEILPGD